MLILRKPYLFCYFSMPFYFSVHVIKITLTTLDSTFLNATLPRLSSPLYIRLLFFVLCQYFSNCFHIYQAKGTCLYYSAITCSDILYSLFLLSFNQWLFVFAPFSSVFFSYITGTDKRYRSQCQKSMIFPNFENKNSQLTC